MVAKFIHSMIRVLDEGRSIEFYNKALGLSVVDRFDFEDFLLVYLKNNQSDFEIELTVNKGQEEDYSLGDGYGHIAVAVDNIDLEHERFENHSLNPGKIVEFDYEGQPMAKFFFVTDPDGYKIEVIQRMGRYQ